MSRKKAGARAACVLPVLAATLLAPVIARGGHREAGAGLVVERVADGSAAARAGVQAGDVLLAWSREAAPPANPHPAAGPLSSPFELDDVESEQAPRGAVTLSAERGGERLALRLTPGRFALDVRPRLPADLADAFERGAAGAQTGDAAGLAQAASAWRATAAELEARGEPAHAAWLLVRLARFQGQNGQPEESARSFAAAADALGPQRPLWVAHVKAAEALALERRNADVERIIELRREIVHLREQAAPGSLALASAHNFLGALESFLGNLPAAEEHHQRSLVLREREAPHSIVFSHSLNNLGNVAFARGDLATAEHYLRRGLDLRRELLPGGTEVAQSYNNLGGVAWARGDLPTAQGYFEEALAIQQRRAPRRLSTAAMFMNLGVVAFETQQLAEAQRRFEQALEIEEALSPDGLEVAGSLLNLGQVRAALGDRAAARRHITRALAIQERFAPHSLVAAEMHKRLGDLDLDENATDAAETHYRHALTLRAELAPGSTFEAESHHDIMLLQRRAGRRAEALQSAERALTALETQGGRLGGTGETRARFMARHAAYYRDAIDLLRGEGRLAEAFHVLERSRARGFLTLLAERDLDFAEIPEELARERREADAEHDRVRGRLAEAAGRDDAQERERLRAQLEQVRRRQEELRARVRGAAPRLAALQYPEPLDLGAARDELDPGTLLLSYVLGPESGLLFTLGPDGDALAVFELDAGAEVLRGEVQALREQVVRGRHGAGATRLHVLAQALGARLLGPAAERIARARRLLIVPDGPLHGLPWAALAEPGAGAFRYLVAGRPVHVAASATVFAQLKKRRPADGAAPKLAAFGDPVYPVSAAAASAGAEPVLRSLQGQGVEMRPLPATRTEVEGLRELFGDDARVFLGREATEEQAKALGPGPRLVHFACHGVLDNRFPLDSALVLSIPERPEPGRANGLLQAWEIFEQVRLDADLVTLSACETGLGTEQPGEGLLGLTRAFQYAGARSVLSSLWSVGDAATAALMQRFYRALKAGRSKDEALREAQLGALADPAHAHPVHWAAFQLFGDWR